MTSKHPLDTPQNSDGALLARRSLSRNPPRFARNPGRVMKRTRTDDASIEQRVREIINPAFDEWINRKIDSAELDRRRELAHKQATAEQSGSPTAVASWATAAAETGAKSAAEVRCTAIGPASPDVSCMTCRVKPVVKKRKVKIIATLKER